MVESTCAHQLCIGIQTACDLSRQVAHLYAVVEGSGSHFAHLTQQLLVGIRQFHQRDVAHKAEGLLYDIEQRVGAEDDETTDEQVDILLVVELTHVAHTDEKQSKVGGRRSEDEDDSRPKQL